MTHPADGLHPVADNGNAAADPAEPGMEYSARFLLEVELLTPADDASPKEVAEAIVGAWTAHNVLHLIEYPPAGRVKARLLGAEVVKVHHVGE